MENNSIRGNKEAVRNINGLFQSRMKRGIKLRELSQLTGISTAAISRYERQKAIPEIKTYNKLAEVFGWEKVPIPKIIKPEKRVISLQPEEKNEVSGGVLFTIGFTFEAGHIYQIHMTEKQEKEPVKDCVFCYEGKRGIHHMFREVRGNWTRTYTDAQLIGKIIKEIER